MLLICIFSYTNNALATNQGKIAIIIDDMGYNRHNLAFTDLPKAITFAILPFTPYSQKIADAAHRQNREVILHIPMQAQANNHLLGQGALTEGMSKQQHQHALTNALADVKYAIGVNNHMGSKLTEERTPMQWTMELLFQQGLFFVDSVTTAKSVAENSAVDAGLPDLKRSIFLDNIRTPQAMEKQFKQAIEHSFNAPYTIMIGHPYPETLAYLSKRFTEPSEDYQLVKLSQLIPTEQRTLLAKQRALNSIQSTVKSTNNKVSNICDYPFLWSPPCLRNW
jgi:polysaccharide deacetylase 2 family uncharacterized protein YibQ